MTTQQIKTGKTIVGCYGECSGVHCPECGARDYPQVKYSAFEHPIVSCQSCEQPYRVPEGYRPSRVVYRWI